MKYSSIAKAVFGTPWMIMPSMMSTIVEILERRLEGGRLSDAEISERLAIAERTAGPRGGTRLAGSIGQIGVYGVLNHRASMMADMSGGTSVQGLQKAFRQAIADPEISGILLDVDSPGGQVSGIPEFAEEIRNSSKPVVAISNTLCASAAYYLASQASEIVVTPSALIGSVGVVMAHEDESAAEELEGIKTTLVYAGQNKVENYPTTPLSEDARAYMQSLVDDVYGMFVGAVAKGRGISAATVKADFGQGRVLNPKNAVAVGMADRIDTYDGALARLASGRVGLPGDRKGATSLEVLAVEHIDVAAVAAPTELDPVEVPRGASYADAIALAKARRRARGV